MTPEDKTPEQSLNASDDPTSTRPAPWTPPDESAQSAAGGSAAQTEPEADAAMPDTPDVRESAPPVSVDSTSEALASQSGEQQLTEAAAPSAPPAPPTEEALPTQDVSSPPTPQGSLGAPQADASSFTPPTPPTPQPPLGPAAPSKGKLVKLIIALIVVLVLAAGGYFGYKAIKQHKQTASVNTAVNSATANSKATNDIDLGTLNNMVFEAPASGFAGLTKVDNIPNKNATEYSNADGTCIFTYGTATSALDPGNNVNDIVNDALQNVKKSGGQVGSLTAVTARMFKATGSDKMYSMPTVKYTYSMGAEYATGIQSAVILKNGLRALVITACSQQGSAPGDSLLAPLESDARQLTVTAK